MTSDLMIWNRAADSSSFSSIRFHFVPSSMLCVFSGLLSAMATPLASSMQMPP